MRHFFSNIVCGFIYDKDLRKKLRVVLNSPVREYKRFIRADTGLRRPHFRTFVGYQARSLIIGVNDKWVYKFPLRRANYRILARREQRLVQTLSRYSRIPVPDVTLMEYDGLLVRKYDFMPGITLRRAPRDLIMANMDTLAADVARFMYELASSDPAEIRDLKPVPNAKPGYMYGWCQGDICDNFMIDTKTTKITAFIDWEDARFCDFSYMFDCEKRSPAREFMNAVRTEYDRLWNAEHKSK